MIDGGFRGHSLNTSNSIGNCRGGRGDAHGMATSSAPTTEKVTELSVQKIIDAMYDNKIKEIPLFTIRFTEIF